MTAGLGGYGMPCVLRLCFRMRASTLRVLFRKTCREVEPLKGRKGLWWPRQQRNPKKKRSLACVTTTWSVWKFVTQSIAGLAAFEFVTTFGVFVSESTALPAHAYMYAWNMLTCMLETLAWSMLARSSSPCTYDPGWVVAVSSAWRRGRSLCSRTQTTAAESCWYCSKCGCHSE